MKKQLLIIIPIIIIVLVIININLKPKSGTMTCTYIDSNENMKVNMNYKITFKDRNVYKLEAKEIIKSNNDKMLSDYKETLDLMYSIYNDLENYNVKSYIEKDKLITIANINYKELNKKKFIKINKSNEDLYKGKNVPLNNLKKVYESKGAKCKYN